MKRENSNKTRIDLLLVERGLAQSRERAQALVLSGNVLVNDTPITKPGITVSSDVSIRIRGEDHPYVSRGGVKLAKALEVFGLDVSGFIALDVGASTGGFTDALLRGGAQKVLAIDVGTNQLDWKLRSDSRVVSVENVNARNLPEGFIAGHGFFRVDIVVMDVSFISITKVLPAVHRQIQNPCHWVILIKPQFELSQSEVGKGGVVRDDTLQAKARETIQRWGQENGFLEQGLIESPILGTQGNREFLIYWKTP